MWSRRPAYAGYAGLNKLSTPQGFYDLSYRSGINNFIFIETNNEIRKFEFYISNQKNWIDLQTIISYYKSTFGSQKINA